MYSNLILVGEGLRYLGVAETYTSGPEVCGCPTHVTTLSFMKIPSISSHVAYGKIAPPVNLAELLTKEVLAMFLQIVPIGGVRA